MPVEIPPPSEAVMALETSSLHVDIWVDPTKLTLFLAEFQKVFDLVTAEPECSFFEVFQDPDEPGHLRWVENWNAPTTWLAGVSRFR
jgi:quinol monooxygenase YgiN